MMKVALLFAVVLILVSGTMVSCGGTEKAPTRDDMVNYVKNVWKVVGTANEIQQALDESDKTGDSFFSEVGGISTVISMKSDMDDGEYAKAATKGVA